MAMRWQADPIGQHFSDRSRCPHCQLPGCPGGYNHEGTAFFCSVGIGTLHRTIVDGVVLWRYPNPSVVPPSELDPPAPIILSVTIPVHELELLRAALAERDSLRARNDDLARQLEELHARLDVLETEPTAASLLRMQRELAIERTMRKQQNAVIARTDLTVRDRVIIAAAIDVAHAYRVPPDFGVAAPSAEPVRVAMGALAERIGVPARTLAPALKAAHERGLLTRKQERHGDGTDIRTDVFVGPPTGLPTLPKEDLRKKAQQERRESSRQQRAKRELDLSSHVEEMKAAATQAHATGCPSCGGDLLGVSYFCAHCNHEHPINEFTTPICPKPTDGNTAPPASHMSKTSRWETPYHGAADPPESVPICPKPTDGRKEGEDPPDDVPF